MTERPGPPGHPRHARPAPGGASSGAGGQPPYGDAASGPAHPPQTRATAPVPPPTAPVPPPAAPVPPPSAPVPPPAAPAPAPKGRGRTLVACGATGVVALVAGIGIGSAGGGASAAPRPRPTGTAAAHPAPAARAAAARPAARTVTYVVTGGNADVTYGPAGSDLTGHAPMKVTGRLGNPSYYAITAQLQGGGTVGCRIEIGGRVVSRSTASGGYNIASCEAVQDLAGGGWSDADSG